MNPAIYACWSRDFRRLIAFSLYILYIFLDLTLHLTVLMLFISMAIKDMFIVMAFGKACMRLPFAIRK